LAIATADRGYTKLLTRRGFLKFLCFYLFAGRADKDELFQTRSKFWDRPEVLHGVAARGAYQDQRIVWYWRGAFDDGD
jgi:hypothetical protein